ncbi:hypothetical protein TNCV_4971511 [Trichonephila clavipes]|nr:hypothetical protein TNCV_4971511 [Trichonephila clavipes]
MISAWNWREGKYSPVPAPVVSRTAAHKMFGPTDLTSTYSVCSRKIIDVPPRLNKKAWILIRYQNQEQLQLIKNRLSVAMVTLCRRRSHGIPRKSHIACPLDEKYIFCFVLD